MSDLFEFWGKQNKKDFWLCHPNKGPKLLYGLSRQSYLMIWQVSFSEANLERVKNETFLLSEDLYMHEVKVTTIVVSSYQFRNRTTCVCDLFSCHSNGIVC